MLKDWSTMLKVSLCSRTGNTMLSLRSVCAEGLEYNAESKVSLC